jgi:hypothetical protein
MIHEGDVPSVQCDVNLRWSKSVREVHGRRFAFIDFNVPALASRLIRIEIALWLSENIILFATVAYKCIRQRGPDKHLVFRGSYLDT